MKKAKAGNPESALKLIEKCFGYKRDNSGNIIKIEKQK